MEPESTIAEWHQKYLWTRLLVAILGVWLIATSFTFGESGTLVHANDIVCGLLFVWFAYLGLSSRREWVQWAIAGVGVWLQLAPVFFWATSSSAYLNDTMTGAVALLGALLIPGTPSDFRTRVPLVPRGWSYNPSAFSQRLPVLFFACSAWWAARYMAAYQLGYTTQMWDPLFGDGTFKVITSDLSRSFPISDAGLGAFIYTLEALLVFKGGEHRWYTMPWLVILFGLLVVPVGFVSILLIISQPLVVGHWCFWCLFTACCMLSMLVLSVDEAVAVVQYLRFVWGQDRVHFWSILWHGGPDTEETEQQEHVLIVQKADPAWTMGISTPCPLRLTTILGGWLMLSPVVLHEPNSIAAIAYITGPLVITFSVTAMAEVVRAARWCNVGMGVLLLILPWIVSPYSPIAQLESSVIGVFLILLSRPRGTIHEKYGDWARYIV